jgi:hypothetical protein
VPSGDLDDDLRETRAQKYVLVNGNSFALKAIRLEWAGRTIDRDKQLHKGKERDMFLKLTDAEGLWSKVKNHVGVKVKHPVSPATRELGLASNDPGVKKSVSVCPYCAVGCSTLVYHRDGRIMTSRATRTAPSTPAPCAQGSASTG